MKRPKINNDNNALCLGICLGFSHHHSYRRTYSLLLSFFALSLFLCRRLAASPPNAMVVIGKSYGGAFVTRWLLCKLKNRLSWIMHIRQKSSRGSQNLGLPSGQSSRTGWLPRQFFWDHHEVTCLVN